MTSKAVNIKHGYMTLDKQMLIKQRKALITVVHFHANEEAASGTTPTPPGHAFVNYGGITAARTRNLQNECLTSRYARTLPA